MHNKARGTVATDLQTGAPPSPDNIKRQPRLPPDCLIFFRLNIAISAVITTAQKGLKFKRGKPRSNKAKSPPVFG